MAWGAVYIITVTIILTTERVDESKGRPELSWCPGVRELTLSPLHTPWEGAAWSGVSETALLSHVLRLQWTPVWFKRALPAELMALESAF